LVLVSPFIFVAGMARSKPENTFTQGGMGREAENFAAKRRALLGSPSGAASRMATLTQKAGEIPESGPSPARPGLADGYRLRHGLNAEKQQQSSMPYRNSAPLH